MENKTNDNADSRWVDEQLATLAPPPAWQPDSDAALRRLTQQQPRQRTGVPRLVMAAAILVFTGAIMALLPWKLLWNPSQSETAGVEAPDQQSAADLADQFELELEQNRNQSLSSSPAAAAEPPPQLIQIPEVRVPEVPRAEAPRIPTVQPAPEPVLGQIGLPQSNQTEVQRSKKQNLPIFEEIWASTLNGNSGITQPRLLSQVAAGYSEDARQARLQGTVELLCLVRTDGTVEVQEVTQSLGYGLDEKAIEAVSRWRFEPGRKDGQPVPVQTRIRVHFSLR